MAWAIAECLGDDAPAQVFALGNLDLLALPKTALFCSARCAGQAILATYDQTARWRDMGCCVISGFHSPVEKECLRILLRGQQPIIWFAHIIAGGQMERLAKEVCDRIVPCPGAPASAPLR